MKDALYEKVEFLITEKTRLKHFNSFNTLPIKCPICRMDQKPKLIAVSYKNNESAKIKCKCISENCSVSFVALYIKGNYYKKKFVFIC